MKKQIEIRENAASKFFALVKKANSVLDAKNEKAISYQFIDKCEIKQMVEINGRDVEISMPGIRYEIEIPNSLVKFDGFRLIGSFREVSGVWIKTTIDNSANENCLISRSNFRCDHCHTNRPGRKHFYFFIKDDRSLFVVAASCVKKYFGINCDQAISALGSLISSFDKLGMAEDKDKCESNLLISKQLIYDFTKLHTGNFSAWNSSEDEKTSAKVRAEIVEVIKSRKYEQSSAPENFDQIVKNYWVNRDDNSGLTANCKTVSELEAIPMRLVGIYSFAVFKAFQIASINEPSSKPGEFVGTIGERFSGIGIITEKRMISNDFYGESLLVKFDDENDNHFCFFCSGKTSDMAKSIGNEKFKVSGKISKFNEYNGRRENCINHVKLEEI